MSGLVPETTTPIVSETPVKPVVPAEEIPVAPAHALDGIAAQPTIFDKVLEATKPYVEKIQETTKPYTDKIQETTKPYTDAATAKAKELIEKVEGSSTPPHSAALPPKTESLLASEKSVPAPSTTSTASTETLGDVGTAIGGAGDKAAGFLQQGLATVSSTFTTLTHTIDEKTKSDSHPGIVTQAQAAIQKGVAKVDGFLNESPVPGTTGAVPVQTTTNTVPHPTL